jgi:hypothetical protein
MPEAIAVAAAKAAEFVSAAVYSGLTAVGVSAANAALISTYAASITAVSVATLAYVGPSLLFRPSIPDPEFARSARKQAIPDRVSGYGRARVGGAYMLWEAVGTYAYVVLAQVDGLSDGVEQLYLNDQKETVGSDGYVQQGSDLRYGVNSDLVQIAYRDGLPTETRYDLIPTDVWPANARGDGIASLMMIAKSSSKEQFLRDYPNALPIPSTVRRLQLCWDPRLGARGSIDDDGDKLASATWQWTDNPILQLLDYKTAGSGGPAYPIGKFLPRIGDWIEAANVCDELVALKGGGTEKRYRAGGTYLHSTADADVTATLLATCDGWLAQDIDGNFTVQAGKYYEPTVTVTADHIVGMSVIHGKKDEEATNVMVVSFTDPTFDFTEVETDPMRDEANIALIGVERAQRLSLPWVQSNSQAQRLGKIALGKQTQPISGTITTTLDGLRAWGERRIRIQADPNESADMANIIVDILPITMSPDFTVSIPFVSCDPNGYAWNADIDQGDGPGDDTAPLPQPVEPPVIVNAYDSGDGRIAVDIETTQPGSTYVLRWRFAVDFAWQIGPAQTATYIPPYDYATTGIVSPTNYVVQAALVTASGAQTEWSIGQPVTIS